MTRGIKHAHVIVAVLAVGYFGKSCEAGRLRALHAEATTRADSMAIEAVAQRAEADGWQSVFADSVGNLTELLAEGEGGRAALARDLLASRAEVRALVTIQAAASGVVESTGLRVDTVAVESVSEYVGEFDDGVLAAGWQFVTLDARLLLDYTVGIRGEIIQAEGGDGRVLFTARSLTPRASFVVDSLLFTPPAPRIEVRGAKWWWVVAGVVGGYLAGR